MIAASDDFGTITIWLLSNADHSTNSTASTDHNVGDVLLLAAAACRAFDPPADPPVALADAATGWSGPQQDLRHPDARLPAPVVEATPGRLARPPPGADCCFVLLPTGGAAMPELGTVKKHGYDHEGKERRERLEAVVECDGCGKEVELWSDTEEWRKLGDFSDRWRHSAYGPAQGVCCQNLYVHSFEGCFRYDLSTSHG